MALGLDDEQIEMAPTGIGGDDQQVTAQRRPALTL